MALRALINDGAASARVAALEPQRLGRYPLDYVDAVRAFRRLAVDKDDTLQAFIVIRALSGRSISKGYKQLLETAEGGVQAYHGAELADRLQDRAWLASCMPNSVGACYREFVARRDFSAYGLADESKKLSESDLDAAHPVAWYARRLRDIHDVFHVLTGYGTDALGEACVVAFTFAQTGNLGLGFLAAGAAIELKRACRGQPFAKAIFQAWRLGRQANWLPALDYERLFAEPLELARARLKITIPRIYHAIPPAARNAYRYPPDQVLDDTWAPERQSPHKKAA